MPASVDRASKPGLTRFLRPALILIFGALCAWPNLRWLAHPCLFDDDFQRVGSLRRSTLGESLFRPFNEHVAPLFETVSWLAWQTSGREVMALPLAFQLSSILAAALTVGMLGAVAWREFRSVASTMVCVAILSLSAVSAETVFWFSASSFEWSALALLGAWYAAIRANESPGKFRRVGWLVAASLGCLAAPAFSAIGLLAGPIVALRLVSDSGSFSWRIGSGLAPAGGTALYLLCYQGLTSGANLSTSSNIPAALWATLESPAAVLIPALFGQDCLALNVPGLVLAGMTVAGLAGAVVWSIRCRQRSLVFSSLALIAGGYFLTYATRARTGDLKIFEVQRYHLFPQIGLALLIGSMARPLMRRLDHHATARLCVSVVLTTVFAFIQTPRMQAASERQIREVDQSRFLVATLYLEKLCNERKITLDQAMKALDPTRTPWFPRRERFNPLLHIVALTSTVPTLSDDQVRPVLLEALMLDDREAIFGGLDATRYGLSSAERLEKRESIETRLVKSERMSATGGNSYRAAGRGSWLEFKVGLEADGSSGLVLPDLRSRHEVEVWWAGENGDWSPLRSMRWTPDLGQSSETQGISLDRLPHWRAGFVRKVRLIFREWGPVSAGSPRFLRGSKGGLFKES